MTPPQSLTAVVLTVLTLLSAGFLPEASAYERVALTNQPTLNDLIRRVPTYTPRRDRTLASLSAIQEMVIVHERKMMGDGLPAVQRALFSANYSNILSALIDDRITEVYGRDLLAQHRHLLGDAQHWADRKNPDPEIGQTLVVKLKNLSTELQENAEPLSAVPVSLQTPLINGHQLWVEELLVWGCHCRELSRGDLGRIGVYAARLERFERAYKRNGYLHESERRRLHERLLDLQRSVIAILERRHRSFR